MTIPKCKSLSMRVSIIGNKFDSLLNNIELYLLLVCGLPHWLIGCWLNELNKLNVFSLVWIQLIKTKQPIINQ